MTHARYIEEIRVELFEVSIPKKIEYLGYILSCNSIAINQRHTEAVRNFPQSRNLVNLKIQRFLR